MSFKEEYDVQKAVAIEEGDWEFVEEKEAIEPDEERKETKG